MRSLARVGFVLLAFCIAPSFASDFEETKQEAPDPGYAMTLPPELIHADLDLARREVGSAFRAHAMCMLRFVKTSSALAAVQSSCVSTRAALSAVLPKASLSSLIPQIDQSLTDIARSIQ